ncbi:MAG: PHP domain-containing protein [Nitrospinae bacterium]|nr:PHP domain-containing protein [Nitrospinota bacterium]
MIIDLHIHTNRYSMCSILDPTNMLKRAQKLKLDGIVIMEHNHIWGKEEIEELKREVGGHGLIVLRGQEIRGYRRDGSAEGDFLAFGFYETIDKELSSTEIIHIVHDNGGIIIAAHPYRDILGIGDHIYDLDIDGIEVLNPNHRPSDIENAERARKIMDIAGTGGSDAHNLLPIGYYLTSFERDIEREEDLIKEIREKRCSPIRYEDIKEYAFS